MITLALAGLKERTTFVERRVYFSVLRVGGWKGGSWSLHSEKEEYGASELSQLRFF